MIDDRFSDRLNFRDLGGYKTRDGRVVAYNLFYRGAGLNFFNHEELESFKKIGIKTIMDLRSNREISVFPDPEFEGIKRIEHSGLSVKGSEDIDWSPAGMRKIGGPAFEQLEQIKGYYKKIAFDNEAFKIMMKEIIADNLPIYFHCATGKDRTGVAAMIILLALGVEREDIRRDYLLSNEYRKDIIEESLKQVTDQAKDHPEINTLVRLQDGVIEEVYDIVMDSIDSKYPHIEDYLLAEYDIDEDTLNKFRDRCLIF